MAILYGRAERLTAKQKRRFSARAVAVNGTLEFDGFMDFRVALACGAASGQCALSALQLNLTYSRSATRYVMGLAEPAQEWPPAPGTAPSVLEWRWAEAINATAHRAGTMGWMSWVGDVSHGMRLKLKGPEDVWDEPATFFGRAPLPMCWAAGDGALTLSGSSLSAHSGARTLAAGERLELRFDLVTTPVKKRDPKHFKWRYLMGCGGCDYPGGKCKPSPANGNMDVGNMSQMAGGGEGIVVLHQGCNLNPYAPPPAHL